MTEYAYIEQLRLSPLRPSGSLPRVAPRLVQLMLGLGAIEPVVVRQVGVGDYEILANVAVWMAAQRAQLEKVPVHVLEGLSDEEAAEILKVEGSGYETDPINEAEFFQEQLDRMDKGGGRYRAVANLAYLTGHSRPYISHSLRLLKLPQSIQDLVRHGQLTAGHARALVGIKNRRHQLTLAEDALAGRQSVRQLEAAARSIRTGGGPVVQTAADKPNKVDPNVRRLESKISEQLGCTVSLDTDEKAMVVMFHDYEILDGILEKLGINPL